jgi:uncharacterized membrane protein YeaQ/YmgE (transglycosylase-associated protein family)
MTLIATLGLGLLIGNLFGRVFRDHNAGPGVNCCLGLAGACAGAVLGYAFGFYGASESRVFYMAIAGAIVVLSAVSIALFPEASTNPVPLLPAAESRPEPSAPATVRVFPPTPASNWAIGGSSSRIKP